MLYCIVMYCIVLYCIALYRIVSYRIVSYRIVLYCIVLYCIALHCIALHCIALHCIALHCIVLYCIVLQSKSHVSQPVYISQVCDRMSYYWSRPVTINVHFHRNKTLVFPAVTICNQNAFRYIHHWLPSLLGRSVGGNAFGYVCL